MARERANNPLILSEIVLAVENLKKQRSEPTFNSLAQELAQRQILAFRRSLRRYLDLLSVSGVFGIKYEKTSQPNIRKKQVYSIIKKDPLVEAGVGALLFHGLNWNVPHPKSHRVKTDFQGLALSKLANSTVYASLEDSIVELISSIGKKNEELLVFITALLATKKVNLNYILSRAHRKGDETTRVLCALLLAIEDTLATPKPQVEDIAALFKLRETYSQLKRPPIHTLMSIDASVQKLSKDILTQEQVLEYAGKQLGIRG